MAQRVRFSTLEALPGGASTPDDFLAPFEGALLSLRRPREVFVEGTSSIFWDPPGGVRQPPPLVTDTAPPLVKSSAFVIDNSQAALGVSRIAVSVAYQQTPGVAMQDEVALLQLIVSETPNPADGRTYDLMSSFDPATGRASFNHKGVPGAKYWYWVVAADRYGNTSPPEYLGSRDTLTNLLGSIAVVADAGISFNLSLAP
jgi:hypothetical protein